MKRILAMILSMLLVLGTAYAQESLEFCGCGVTLTSVQDDGNVFGGSNKATGRYIKLYINCTDGSFTWADMRQHIGELTLMDANDNTYIPTGYGFVPEEGASTAVEDMDKINYVGVAPLYDIPAEQSVNELWLVCGNVRVALDGVPAWKDDDAAEGQAEELSIALEGDWTLTGLDFKTPDMENGIFSIDAGLTLNEEFEYGLSLTLGEDGGIKSDIGLSGFLDLVDALPFQTTVLDLKDYTGWSVAEGMLTFAPDDTAFAVALEDGTLRLTWSSDVEILSTTNEQGLTSKSGTVAMEITLSFVQP